MRKLGAIGCALTLAASTCVPAARAAEGAAAGADWRHWSADNEIGSKDSLQRGARNFMAYCSACHSLKYIRYARLATDLEIPDAQLEALLVPPGAKASDYIVSAMPASDAETWFGKPPPDLSLVARSRGPDWIYQFLKTFYADPAAPTGVDNLALPGTAMPHVLSDLQGVQSAVFRNVEVPGDGGKSTTESVFAQFEPGVAGRLSAAEYDEFVRDIVNFLDYVGEPVQAKRMSLGVWVILFLLAFTGIAYLLKQEFWKDVK
jgi:ubiquinol-cytochrome c reductase cytochrome c1 subunit